MYKGLEHIQQSKIHNFHLTIDNLANPIVSEKELDTKRATMI